MKTIYKVISIVLFIVLFTSVLNFLNKRYSWDMLLLSKCDVLNSIIVKPDIIDVSPLFFSYNSRKESVISSIIVHHDEIKTGTYEHTPIVQIHNYHIEKGIGGFAYHYYIDRHGNVFKTHKHTDVTSHTSNKKYKAVSLSICLQGDFTKEVLKEKQQIELTKLLNYLMNQYDLESSDVFGHKEVNETKCPGNINLEWIIEYANELHWINDFLELIENSVYKL